MRKIMVEANVPESFCYNCDLIEFNSEKGYFSCPFRPKTLGSVAGVVPVKACREAEIK